MSPEICNINMGPDKIVLLPCLDSISNGALYMLHFSYNVLNTGSPRLTLTFSFAGSWRDLQRPDSRSF